MEDQVLVKGVHQVLGHAWENLMLQRVNLSPHQRHQRHNSAAEMPAKVQPELGQIEDLGLHHLQGHGVHEQHQE